MKRYDIHDAPDDGLICTCLDPEKAGGNKADGSHWVPCPKHDRATSSTESFTPASSEQAKQRRAQARGDQS